MYTVLEKARAVIDEDVASMLVADVRKKFPDWSDDYARRGIEQLSGFLVACSSVTTPLGPSAIVDEFWHAFILRTAAYADFCDRVAGRFIHHFPDNDGVGESKVERRRATIEAITAAGFEVDKDFWWPAAAIGNGSDSKCTQCHQGLLRQRPHRRLANAAGERTWFNWTQYPDHGPGVEVLSVSPGSRVLDLGCGKGGNLAHVNASACRGVGVDVSQAQIRLARERWEGLELHCADALTFLEAGADRFDAIYSVFGAVWFVDPGLLLPAIRRRLRRVFAFSYASMAAVSGLSRWDLEPEEWMGRLDKCGFSDIRVHEIPPPAGSGPGTMLVRCVAGAG